VIVVDASVALAWSHKDERTPTVAAIAEQVIREGAIVPAIWPTEIANGLEIAVRRGRISVPQRDELLANFRRLTINIEMPSLDLNWTSSIWIAHRFGLTVYDAAYLELALRVSLPLATLDKQLTAAGREAGAIVLPEAT
jgi:predicted nucleic acid-binding protein